MKTLYLVRHAKSSWKYPELSDFDRPLNGRGKRATPEMGQRLKKRKVLPDLMLSSPANRAITTCKVIAQAIGYNTDSIQPDERIYHASADILLHVVQQVEVSVNCLMLFGHNPGFTDFANKLAKTNIWNIPTCGVFACEFDVDSWSQVKFGEGRQVEYDFPKNTAK